MKNYAPLRLAKNVTYPSYQLYATIDNRKTEPETALKIAILIAINWIKEKFSEFELPKELDMPSPEEYESFSMDRLSSFRIDRGYVVDVVYIPEISCWSLQLVEPDLGLGGHEAVPGRIFTTNIGYRLTDGVIECGFNTIVSDPQHITQKSRVFRLGLIKRLVRHPLLGLNQCRTLIENYHTIDTSSKMRSLRDFINDDERLMPVALFTMVTDGGEESGSYPSQIEFTPRNKYYTICHSFLNGSADDDIRKLQFTKNKEDVWEARPEEAKSSEENRPAEEHAPEKTEDAQPYLPYDIEQSAHDKMGYGHYIVIGHDKLNEFNKMLCTEMKAGDVCIIEPQALGGKVTVYPYQTYCSRKEELISEIADIMQNYPLDKPMKYGKVLFSPAARLYQQDQIIRSTRSIKTLVSQNDEHTALLKQKYHEKIQLERQQNQLLTDKVARLESIIEDKEQELAAMRDKLEEIRMECERKVARTEKQLDYFHSLNERPTETEDIPLWVEKKFEGRMIFHQRAVDLIRSVPTHEIDMKLLCDALEYLATEYYDFYTKQITEEEARYRGSLKYNRPFEVTPTGTGSIMMTPYEYKVKYKLHGSTSKEVALDMHLKAGVAATHLIRIYFFYDSYNRYFVVGSLPKHLKTTTHKT